MFVSELTLTIFGVWTKKGFDTETEDILTSYVLYLFSYFGMMRNT